jgi:hypothetical protein
MKLLLCISFFLSVSPLIGHAENLSKYTIVTVDAKGNPIEDVYFIFFSDKKPSTVATNSEGITEINLSLEDDACRNVKIQLYKINPDQPDWVFISPWDEELVIPKYSKLIKLVLARRSDLIALSTDEGLRAITENMSANYYMKSKSEKTLTDKQLHQIQTETADKYGLSVPDLNKALQEWNERTGQSNNIYDKELLKSVSVNLKIQVNKPYPSKQYKSVESLGIQQMTTQ